MAKCYQCPSPAMYAMEDQNRQTIPLCLDCYYKVAQLTRQQQEDAERMINFLSDHIDSTVGLPPTGARFPPRPRAVHLGDVRLNNISVNNSVVGTINTGSIGTVDQSITALQTLGERDLAEAIKALSESILRSNDLSRNQRNELVEILSVVAKEAATPKESRQNTVVHTLLERAATIISAANDLTDVASKWWPVIVGAFSAVTGS